MLILPVLPIFFATQYLTPVFLLAFVFGLLLLILRG